MFSILALKIDSEGDKISRKKLSRLTPRQFFSQNFVTLVADFEPKFKTWSRQIMFYTISASLVLGCFPQTSQFQAKWLGKCLLSIWRWTATLLEWLRLPQRHLWPPLVRTTNCSRSSKLFTSSESTPAHHIRALICMKWWQANWTIG